MRPDFGAELSPQLLGGGPPLEVFHLILFCLDHGDKGGLLELREGSVQRGLCRPGFVRVSELRGKLQRGGGAPDLWRKRAVHLMATVLCQGTARRAQLDNKLYQSM